MTHRERAGISIRVSTDDQARGEAQNITSPRVWPKTG